MASTKKVSRKERERRRHTEEILLAAEAVFAEKGYDGTRMSDIAERAEFSVGFLYQMCNGKEDLYQSLLESKFKEFKKFVENEIESTSDPFEEINTLIDAHVRFIEENRAFAKIYLVETSPAEIRAFKRLGNRLRNAHTEYLTLVTGIFEKGIQNGVFTPLPPRDLALALEGAIFAFARDYLRESSERSFADMAEVMKRIFFYPVVSQTRRAGKEIGKA